MKQSELKIMIREIVREEVRMELRKFLKETKINARKKVTSRKVVKTKPVIREQQKATYSTNKILNEVLNETAHDGAWQQMGDEPYTTENMSSVLQNSYAGVMNGSNEISGDQTVASMGVNPDKVPDHVKNALTKDYSSFMKKVADKDKSRRP